MAKEQQNFSKQENEKRRLQKQKEKDERRRERQANKGQGGDELAYVDENGNITSTPPDPSKRREVAAESIQIGVPKQEDRPVESTIRLGVVSFFNSSKGYGFIRDQGTQESIFVHVNNLGGLTLSEGDRVTFETEPGLKGPTAFRS